MPEARKGRAVRSWFGNGARAAGASVTKLPVPSLTQRTRQKRWELTVIELEAVALTLFEQSGFSTVTVEQIAAAAKIAPRTFYRYFPAKEDVLQVRTRRRAAAIRDALAVRPADEGPLHSLRLAIEVAVAAEDPALLKRWFTVVAATPSALRTVLGGCILTMNGMMSEFFGARLRIPSDALVPTMLAAAVGGVIQAAETRWFVSGGNLAMTISEGIRVLEEAVGMGLVSRAGRKSRVIKK
jgi:TetR/AcrR family transcriptional regulator, regulator of mycofactocin system